MKDNQYTIWEALIAHYICGKFQVSVLNSCWEVHVQAFVLHADQITFHLSTRTSNKDSQILYDLVKKTKVSPI